MKDEEQELKSLMYEELNINCRTINNLRYTDDTALLSKTEE